MEPDEGELVAAALFTATSNMFTFTLTALQMSLKQERMGGFTSEGRQIEPPIAHLVRPALQAFLDAHPTVGAADLTEGQAAIANQTYQQHIGELRDQVLNAIHEFEI